MPTAAQLPPPPAQIHCVGICGMGLGPLAIYLSRLGYKITGEDKLPNPAMLGQLRSAGIELTGKPPPETRFLVYSNAVPATHPARQAAAEKNIPSAKRGEVLAQLAANRRLVAVCGSHGKTTVTAMLVTALRAAGQNPDYILGALFADDKLPPAHATQTAANYLVAEIDESDGTIENFSPEITLANNLSWDHPDFYKTHDQLLGTFRALFARTRAKIFLNETSLSDVGASLDDARRRDAVAQKLHTFGPSETADYRGTLSKNENGTLQISLSGKFPETTAQVAAIGEFNALNATAALAVASFIAPDKSPSLLLQKFPGVRRRQTILFNDARATVVEDYAHHPEEIAALLKALRDAWPRRQLVAVFQSHRFSRTKQFLAEFAKALSAADHIHLLETYGAGELLIPGGTLSDLRAAIEKIAPTKPVTDGTLPQHEGTLVFIGAGDIDKLAHAYTRQLKNEQAAQPPPQADSNVTQIAKSADGASRPDKLPSPQTDAAFRLLAQFPNLIRQNVPLAPKTTMRVGGNARLYAEPESIGELRQLVIAARQAAVPLRMLGRGSNLIIPDAGVDALVIGLHHPNWEKLELLPDGTIFAAAACRLKQICAFAMRHGISGFEGLEGIPASLGGALRMNAGAMGTSIFDRVLEIHHIDADGELHKVPRDRLNVAYRHCDVLENGSIAVGAVLSGAGQDSAENIGARMRAFAEQRKAVQPREPSAGCIFKNPEGDSAGRLIDTAGLKGARVGGAMVSPVHANFIVNTGGATADDIIKLVHIIREKVSQKHGILLEPEAILFGANWAGVAARRESPQ